MKTVDLQGNSKLINIQDVFKLIYDKKIIEYTGEKNGKC